MKHILALFALLWATSVISQAQSLRLQQDTLVWKVTELVDSNTKETWPFSCTFVTYPQGTVEWIQKDGEFVTVFSRKAVRGSWTNAGNNGSLESDVLTSEIKGSVRFKRTSDKINIEFFFPDSTGRNTMPFAFVVNEVSRRQP